MSPQLAELLDDLAAANRILAHYGVLDGFGHVSARHPERPGCFLLSRSLAPELVTEGAEATEAATFEALKAAYDRSTATMKERMEELTGGLNLPGLGV